MKKPKKKKPVDKNTRKEIHQAAQEIPDMIAEGMKRKKEKEKNDMIESVFAEKREKNKRITLPQAGDKKKRLLWGSVGLITVVIFGMWTLNMQTLFVSRGEAAASGAHRTPWAAVGDDFDTAFESLKEEGNSDLDNALRKRKESEQTQEHVQSILKNIIGTSTTAGAEQLPAQHINDTAH